MSNKYHLLSCGAGFVPIPAQGLELLDEFGFGFSYLYMKGVSKKRFCLTEIPDGTGSGEIPMCGSCIERFDPGSIFNKWQAVDSTG